MQYRGASGKFSPLFGDIKEYLTYTCRMVKKKTCAQVRH